MRESKVEREVVDWAIANGWLTMKYTGERGYPDRIFINDGVTVWVEFKSKGEKPSPVQMYQIARLRVAGAIAIWADDFESATQVLSNQLEV